jgi:hypothetical protein
VSKIIKKGINIFMWVFTAFAVLFLFLYLLINLSFVQTWLVKRLANHFAEVLNTRVEIDRVSISFPRSFILKGFHVDDLQGKTLLNVPQLEVSAGKLLFSENNILLHTVELNDAAFNLRIYRGETENNMAFIIHHFAPVDSTSSKSKVDVEKLKLTNCRFNFVNENIEPKNKGINFSDLSLSGVSGTFSDIILNGDSVSADIKNFRAADQSGFKINDMQASFRMTPTDVTLNGFVLKTPGSEIHSDAKLQFESFNSFNDFASKVTMNATLGKSTIAFNDAIFFTDGIGKSENKFTMQGKLKGTLGALKIKELILEYGRHTKLTGDVSINGLPDFKSAFIDGRIEKLQSSSYDVATLPLYDSAEKKLIILPDNVNKLGVFSFSGKFTGFYNDFVAYGNLSTALGFASTDIHVKTNKDNKNTSYSGRLALSGFDAGTLAGVSDVGRVSLNVNLQGSGLKLNEMKETASGTISQLEYKGYNYNNIVFSGNMEKSLFKGTLAVHETNLDVDFDGTIDMRGKIPDYNFVATVGYMNLDNLKLVKEGKEQRLRTKLSINASGNSLQTIEGSVLIRDSYYNYEKTLYYVNNISLTTFGFGKGRTIYIRSDFMDGEISGLLDIKNFVPSVETFLAQYVPNAYTHKTLSVYNQNASFRFTIKNAELLTRLFAPGIEVDAGTELYGKLNTTENIFLFQVQAPTIKYHNIGVTNFDFKIGNDSSYLVSNLRADKVLIGQGAGIALFRFNASAQNNNIQFTISASDADTFPNRLNLSGTSIISSPWSSRFVINESNIYLNNEKWEMSTGNFIEMDSSKIKINGLTLSRGSQLFGLDGVIAQNSSDRLEFLFNNFSMQNINPLLARSGFKFGGVMDGKFSIAGLLSKLNVTSSATIANLAMNSDTIGNANIQSLWDDEKQQLDADIKVVKGTHKIIDIEGKYLVKAEKNNFDFKVSLSDVYIHPFEKFVDDVFTDLYGKLSADFTLTGTPEDPEMNGTAKISKGNFVLNFLNTRYSFTDEITITPTYFGFNNLTLNDVNGKTATLNGKLMHRNFKNLTLNLLMQTNHFQCLNTGYTGTEIYYGTAIATGFVTLSGPVKSLAIDLNLTANKGTRIFFPLQSSAVISENNFITFVNRNDTVAAQIKRPPILPGVSLTSNLEFTPDADIQVIFDEKIGDVIRGNGYGNMKLTLTPAGEFSINGNYTIQEGDYLFTLKNIINKKFIIEPGGMISFNGDPYDANVDLDAIYKVRANLSELFPGDTISASAASGRAMVDCHLILRGKLFNPTVKFDLDLPGADATTQSIVKNTLNTEEEMSRQVMTLVVLNRFAPMQPTGASVGNYQGSAKASGSELLSNQVSNWLNQFSNKVNIGVNYRPRDAISSEELEFVLSTQQFNDRISIDLGVGYAGDSPSAQNSAQNGSTIIGDFNAEYKLTPDGKIRLKAFNRTNNNALISNNSPYTQGVGVFYRVEFDKLRDLWRKVRSQKTP